MFLKQFVKIGQKLSKLETFFQSMAVKEYYKLVNVRLFHALKLDLFTVNFLTFPHFLD